MLLLLTACLITPVLAQPPAGGDCSTAATALNERLAPVGGGVECEGGACAVWYRVTPGERLGDEVFAALVECVPRGIEKHYVAHESVAAEGDVYGGDPKNPRLSALATSKANALVGIPTEEPPSHR